jgi:hypothetical protein
VICHDSPRMPASYAVLFIACLVPPLYRAVMTSALERWGGNRQIRRRRGAG